MRITYSHQGKESVQNFDTREIIIGRPKDDAMPDLDLSPDDKVSRTHARIRMKEGLCRIEDLGSSRGTLVNGEEIKGKGERLLSKGDTIDIGETTLLVEFDADAYRTRLIDAPRSAQAATQLFSLDASIPAFAPAETEASDTERRLSLFYDLPMQFAAETRLDSLLQLIVERVVDVIPGARRGALLVKDRQTERLALKAHLPAGNPAVSKNLSQQAMERRQALIWPSPPPANEAERQATNRVMPSIVYFNIQSAMYAPLLWKDNVMGVVCVDNCETCGAFRGDDLRLLQAVAHHAAMAVANLQLQEELRRETETLANSLKLVSPQIAERLKQQHGPIQLGGEFRDATILFSDIRGFTNMSATMTPHDVTDMLKDYFERLVPVIFTHQGTIDKFVGDAILAVFGSPDPDEHQHINAVRAALEMQAAMREVNARRAADNKRTGELGIGIHCGEVVHGFIGTERRMEFTVIGDAVNRASRYCDGAPGSEVLISHEVHQWIWDAVEAEPTTIQTKHEGTFPAYRVKGIKER